MNDFKKFIERLSKLPNSVQSLIVGITLATAAYAVQKREGGATAIGFVLSVIGAVMNWLTSESAKLKERADSEIPK